MVPKNESLIMLWRRLIDEIALHWYEAYIVWWAVRDLLLDKEPEDVDIATNMPIEEIEKHFDTHDIGKNKTFWVVVVNFEWVSFDVAQYRKDWKYTDWRRPDTVEFVPSIEEDLARRDITINAMAYNGKSIIDPFWWQEDLKNLTIRFVGNPTERIEEDPLRILRALRFSSTISQPATMENDFKARDAKIEPKSFDAIINNYWKIRFLSKERVTEEIIKMAKNWWMKFWEWLRMLNTYWILEEVLRPIARMNYIQHNFDNHPEWQYWLMNRVIDHVVDCLKEYQWNDPLVILCILFHDVGKPFTYSFEMSEKKVNEPMRHRYKWHDVIWSKFFRWYGKEMKLSNDWIDTICYCIENHMNWWNIDKMSKSNIYKIVWHEDYPILEHVVSCDERSTFCNHNIEVKCFMMENWIPSKTPERLDRLLALWRDVRQQFKSKEETDAFVKTYVTGEKIMAAFPEAKWREIWILKWIATEHVLNNRIWTIYEWYIYWTLLKEAYEKISNKEDKQEESSKA